MTLALAGAREASRQFRKLKTDVTDWTRTSVWGGLLVFAGGGTGAQAFARPTYLVSPAFAATCPTQKPRAATTLTARVAAKPKAAEASRAWAAPEAGRGHALNELSMKFVRPASGEGIEIARAERVDFDTFVRIVPALEDLADRADAKLGVEELRRQSQRVHDGERIVRELERIGRKKVVWRVGEVEGLLKSVSAVEPPRALPGPPAASGAPRPPAAKKVEDRSAAEEAGETDSFSFVHTTGALSLNCDGGGTNAR
jgi:hypothetical protein